jgi:hypothetical protein
MSIEIARREIYKFFQTETRRPFVGDCFPGFTLTSHPFKAC